MLKVAKSWTKTKRLSKSKCTRIVAKNLKVATSEDAEVDFKENNVTEGVERSKCIFKSQILREMFRNLEIKSHSHQLLNELRVLNC